jgi:hypothetical protein
MIHIMLLRPFLCLGKVFILSFMHNFLPEWETLFSINNYGESESKFAAKSYFWGRI